MYTEPTIVTSERSGRAYISFYINGIRQRIYSGRALGLKIFPNRAKTQKERMRILQALKAELLSALAAENYPYQPSFSHEPDVQLILSAVNRLTIETKQANAVNDLRLVKLEQIHNLLADYLRIHDDNS